MPKKIRTMDDLIKNGVTVKSVISIHNSSLLRYEDQEFRFEVLEDSTEPILCISGGVFGDSFGIPVLNPYEILYKLTIASVYPDNSPWKLDVKIDENFSIELWDVKII